MIIPDDYASVIAVVEDAARAMREFMDLVARKIAEAAEELGEWVDYDKPVWPRYIPVGSFRPLVIHQLHIYTSGFL